MGQKVIIIGFGRSLGYRLRRETISTPFADLSSTRLCMFKIVFGDSSLYPKNLHLFCLLRLISASADRIGYITNFCIMIELLHDLKSNSC